MIAGITNLLFAIHLFIQPPALTVKKPQLLSQAKQPIAHQLATQTVTTTQAISTATTQGKLRSTPVELYRRVAARSLGEGSSAVAEIACTIKNRLRVSKAPLTVVLRAYYAHDKTPRPEHIEMVRKVFEGELPCPQTWWYALSRADTRHFRPHPRPAAVISRNSSEVWIYDH